ncbi:hypothetical protein GVY41_05910 [Frigidibacter albus]|uniref:Uncharacterized protein n=2 Tax=Frigidibacter albus TaxID=1465486 RepID=A0A6L8VH48_9RHOB|nr:hypothetical protein [Frigidibacter albus]MZQ88649.1 hypothetical protein [Frigidibacter albus]NBE30542.1 hypothetical protein [Frigidibacter albus]GGH49638.1 hypothetical protein GCM10011341_12090 [Frigidibacter albus]
MPRYTPLKLTLRALLWGLLGLLALPPLTLFLVLGLGHLQGACGAGSSGGCEMGAAMAALIATISGFGLGAAISLIRDLRRRKV